MPQRWSEPLPWAVFTHTVAVLNEYSHACGEPAWPGLLTIFTCPIEVFVRLCGRATER